MKNHNPFWMLGLALFFIPLNVISQNFDEIVQGVDTINGSSALGSVWLLNENAIPIAVGNSSLIYCAASTYVIGRAIAIGHDGALVDGNI